MRRSRRWRACGSPCGSLRKEHGRTAIQPFIIADRFSIRLNPDAVEVDSPGFRATGSQRKRWRISRRAAKIYRGDYLAEFDLDDADPNALFLFERRRLARNVFAVLSEGAGGPAAWPGGKDADGAIEIAQKGAGSRSASGGCSRRHHPAAAGTAAELRNSPGISTTTCRDILRRELGYCSLRRDRSLCGKSFGCPPRPKSPHRKGPRRHRRRPRQRTRARPSSGPKPAPRPDLLLPAGPRGSRGPAAGLSFLYQGFGVVSLPLHTAATRAAPSLVVLPFDRSRCRSSTPTNKKAGPDGEPHQRSLQGFGPVRHCGRNQPLARRPRHPGARQQAARAGGRIMRSVGSVQRAGEPGPGRVTGGSGAGRNR